jgi:hypothetical protein
MITSFAFHGTYENFQSDMLPSNLQPTRQITYNNTICTILLSWLNVYNPQYRVVVQGALHYLSKKFVGNHFGHFVALV